jgi:hypothetical protein
MPTPRVLGFKPQPRRERRGEVPPRPEGDTIKGTSLHLFVAADIVGRREEGMMGTITELMISSGVQVVSTVLGVYLAARSAYRNTVVRSERDGYFMRAALLDELKENIAAVEAWSTDFQVHLDRHPAIQAHAVELNESADQEIVRTGHAWVAWWKAGSAFKLTDVDDNPSVLSLSTFIWDAMKQQSITFQLPANFLSEVRRYYRSISSSMPHVSTRENLARQQNAAVTIWRETRHMRETVVPAFEKTLKIHRAELARKGITLDA